MRAIRIEPGSRSVAVVTINVPQTAGDALAQIKALTAWNKPTSYHYRNHWLWVDAQVSAGHGFTLAERGTTLGPFRGEAWIVAQSSQGRLADATLSVDDVHTSWQEKEVSAFEGRQALG